MRGSRLFVARRLVVAMGVVGVLVAPSPQAEATATPAIVRAASYCDVDRLPVSTVPRSCPAESQGVRGHTAANAIGDVAARTFEVGAFAKPNRYVRVGRHASGIVELHSNVATSTGGPVKVVLTNLTGGSITHCSRACGVLNHAFAATAVWVRLLLHGDTAQASPQASCVVTFPGEAAPQSFVVPDDCKPGDAVLDAPPDSTFEVVVALIAQAHAEGGATKARAALSGQVSEIQVP